VERKIVVDDTNDCCFAYFWFFAYIFPKFCSCSLYLYFILKYMRFITLLWSKWKIIVAKIALIQARIILSIFYYIFLLPFGLILVRIFGKNYSNFQNRSLWQENFRRQDFISNLQEQY
jgi:hypothetical protein